MSLQIFWKNSAPPAMEKSQLANEIMCGRGQNHYVFLAGMIITNSLK